MLESNPFYPGASLHFPRPLWSVTHRSGIIKGVVQVQGGISCVAAVLSHCRVLAHKTKGQRTAVKMTTVIMFKCASASPTRAASFDVSIIKRSHKWAEIKEEEEKGPHASREQQHARYYIDDLHPSDTPTFTFHLTHLERVRVFLRLGEARVFGHVGGRLGGRGAAVATASHERSSSQRPSQQMNSSGFLNYYFFFNQR